MVVCEMINLAGAMSGGNMMASLFDIENVIESMGGGHSLCPCYWVEKVGLVQGNDCTGQKSFLC